MPPTTVESGKTQDHIPINIIYGISIGYLGEAQALKDIVDLSGFKQMTDTGGGSGLYSLALCQKYPNLHSTIMDVNETLAVTAEFWLITEKP